MSLRKLRLFWSIALCMIVVGCKREEPPTGAGPLPPPIAGVLDLLFTSSSEKLDWVKSATEEFNRRRVNVGGGMTIRVTVQSKGSRECLEELVAGTSKAHLTSPASSAFINLGNAQWRAKTGRDLIPSPESLVRTPVVIAMWRPMAEALGWGRQPIGWADVQVLAAEPQGWAARGLPGWGPFLFGHTHPQFSNSGLISVFAEVSAAAGRPAGLTVADVQRPEVGEFVHQIESSAVHYGSSTGYFENKMFVNGPGYISAAVLYEYMVIESYAQKPPTKLPIVAIYPKEGTFWSDHPAGIVDAEWVTPEHRDAGRKYLDFLLAREQQETAMAHGFRPARADVPLAGPLDAAHGVNPNEPQTTVEVPSVDVMEAMKQVWRENKKRSNLTLVVDASASMKANGRIEKARAAAQEFVTMLGDADVFRLTPFNSKILPSSPAAPVGTSREQAMSAAGVLVADGGAALYDAIDAAFQEQLARRDQERDKIPAIVVLSNGADTDSKLTLGALLERIRPDKGRPTIRVFTIGYDAGAQADVLKQIAEASEAAYYDGTPENIRGVFKDLSTFF